VDDLGKWAKVIVATALAVAALAVTGSALGATANMTIQSGSVIAVFQADAGETNNLTVTSCGTGCVDFIDGGANVWGGTGIFQAFGCTTPSASGTNGLFPARCTHPTRIDMLYILLGDGNDRVTIGSSVPASITTFVGGGSGNDILVGGPSLDNLHGNDGDDVVVGGASCDVVGGENGNDVLDGGTGADVLSGGAGIDTADYSSRSANLFVALDLTVSGASCTGAPIGNDGEAGEGDNVNEDVENVRGGSGNDFLRGSADTNFLAGNGGDDVLDGFLGADVLAGGSGVDRADYSGRSGKVIASIDAFANDGEVFEGDEIRTDVERIDGGAGPDSLTGNMGDNELRGNGGDDVLNGGGGGVDRLFGGDGNDTLNVQDMTVDDTMDCGGGSDMTYGDGTYPGIRMLPVFDATSACENSSWIFPLQIGP
jgi:Ca2+-binding RTX toxin-like protein